MMCCILNNHKLQIAYGNGYNFKQNQQEISMTITAHALCIGLHTKNLVASLTNKHNKYWKLSEVSIILSEPHCKPTSMQDTACFITMREAIPLGS
jgi:hypothetical protein